LYAFLSSFTGSNSDRKKSFPSKKAFRVTISDETQLTPKKFNTRKGQTLLKKKKPPGGDLQSFSSDPYCASVVDKPRSASVLDVYSDEESNGTSQVSKEPKPIINVSDISMETKSTHLSNTEAKGKLSCVDLGNTESVFSQVVGVVFIDVHL